MAWFPMKVLATTVGPEMLNDCVSQFSWLKRFVHHRKSVQRRLPVARHEYQGDGLLGQGLADWRRYLPTEVHVDQGSINWNGFDELERLAHVARCSC